jgi:hypothetical protein
LELVIDPRLNGLVETLPPFVAIASNLSQILGPGVQGIHGVNIQGDTSIEEPSDDRL